MDERDIKMAGGGIKGKEIFTHKLFDQIVVLENLFLAWQEFRRGKRKKFDVQQFEYNLEDNIFELHWELQNKTYQHSHYTSFFIKDPKLRKIHKASVRDRVLHHAVFRALYPIFDKTFIFDSYSCRINKGTHRAVNRLQKFAVKVSKNNTKNCFVLKCDIKKFFDSIDQKILLALIEKEIKDKEAIRLIKKIIKSFSSLPNKGLPLGNITSQLFANVYLNALDQFVKHKLRLKHYLRYCDDFVILSDDKDFLENLICLLANFLQGKLLLSFHPAKVTIKKYHQGIDFLGYVSFPRHRILRTKTKKRMFKKIEQRNKELAFNKISKESFAQTIQSYSGLLKHCESYKIKEALKSKISSQIF